MTPLVWANFPLMALIFLAIAGIPLWLVLRRPDQAPDHSEARGYLRAKAEVHRAAGRAAPAHAAAVQSAPGRGRWQLTTPRASQPGHRRPAARAARPHGRATATRRRRSDA